jgi:hypothetical protein
LVKTERLVAEANGKQNKNIAGAKTGGVNRRVALLANELKHGRAVKGSPL